MFKLLIAGYVGYLVGRANIGRTVTSAIPQVNFDPSAIPQIDSDPSKLPMTQSGHASGGFLASGVSAPHDPIMERIQRAQVGYYSYL